MQVWILCENSFLWRRPRPAEPPCLIIRNFHALAGAISLGGTERRYSLRSEMTTQTR